MCDPVSIAGAALSGAGMAANSIASNEVQHATNAAKQQTQYLNSIQQSRIDSANKAAEGEYTGFGAGQAAAGQKLGDFLSSTVGGPARSFMAPTASGSTQQAEALANNGTQAFGVQQARSLGNQRSFGDHLADVNRGAARDLQTADQASDFMKGNSAVLGLQLNQAQHAGDGASLFGKILGGVGGLGIKAGLDGAGGKVGNYGSPLGSLFGGDQTYAQVRQAGLDGGLTLNPDGSIY